MDCYESVGMGDMKRERPCTVTGGQKDLKGKKT